MTPARRADPEKWWWLALALAILVLLYYLSPILAPFLLASILAYICNPLVTWLERRGVGRTIAVVLVIVLLLALLVLLAVALVPLFYREVKLLSQQLPVYLGQINDHVVPWLKDRLGIELQVDAAS